MSEHEAAPSLTVTVERPALWTIVQLSGELDHQTQEALAGRLHSIRDEVKPPLICLDLSDLRFCDSMGLNCLVMAWKATRERGGTLVLLRPAGEVARLMSLVGLAEVVPVVDELPG